MSCNDSKATSTSAMYEAASACVASRRNFTFARVTSRVDSCMTLTCSRWLERRSRSSRLAAREVLPQSRNFARLLLA